MQIFQFHSLRLKIVSWLTYFDSMALKNNFSIQRWALTDNHMAFYTKIMKPHEIQTKKGKNVENLMITTIYLSQYGEDPYNCNEGSHRLRGEPYDLRRGTHSVNRLGQDRRSQACINTKPAHIYHPKHKNKGTGNWYFVYKFRVPLPFSGKRLLFMHQ